MEQTNASSLAPCTSDDAVHRHQRYLEHTKNAVSFEDRAVESIDKWLLTLSSGGLAFVSALASASMWPIFEGAKWLISGAVISFVLALISTLSAKACNYMYSREILERIEQVYSTSTEDMDQAMSQVFSESLDKNRRRVNGFNTTGFCSFLVAVIFLATFACAAAWSKEGSNMSKEPDVKKTTSPFRPPAQPPPKVAPSAPPPAPQPKQ